MRKEEGNLEGSHMQQPKKQRYRKGGGTGIKMARLYSEENLEEGQSSSGIRELEQRAHCTIRQPYPVAGRG